MRPTDLALLRTPGVPTVSPDGPRAVVAVSRLDLDADEYRSQLWTVPTDGSAPARPLTHGHRDTGAGVLPGRALAGVHLRRAEGPAPAARAATGGGDAAAADRPPPGCRHAGLVAGLAPAGLHRPGARAPAGTAPTRTSRPEAEAPRLITTLKYRPDDLGFTNDRRSHVFVVALPADADDDGVPAPEPFQVTGGDVDDSDVAWSPDGDGAGVRLRPARGRRPRPGQRRLRGPARRQRAAQGHRLPVGAARTPPTAPTAPPSTSAPSPTSARLGRDFVGRNTTLCRVPAAGGPVEPLLDPEEHDRGDETAGDRHRRRCCLFGIQRRGAVELLRVPLDGGAPEALRRRAVHGARDRRRRRRRRGHGGARPVRR